MDERHWWFASKLQETFHFGGYDNPTLLEDFLSNPEVVELINDFLAPGEPCKLFFYCDEVPSSTSGSQAPSASSRRLHIAAQLTQDVVSGGRVCLYVLRRDIRGEVDVSQMEKELFCGELRHSVLSSLASLLADAYAPLLHSQKDWGECSEDSTINFLQNFDKFSGMLMETATQVQISQCLLQRPTLELWNDLLHQHGKGPLLGEVLMECETLVADWISTTESLLIETTDERLEDPRGSLRAELGKWRRRQTLLSSIVEQLKTKECRMVIATLVAAKSRLLKRWKNIDLQITDAFNTARDRMHYLDMLSPHLEALEASSSPHTVTSSILPGLATAVRQADGLSRVYARSGYLGILLTKISYALVRVCMSDLETYACRNGENHFWDMVSEAVFSETRQPTTSSDNHPLIAKLNSCMQLSTAFKELLQQLKETLLQQQHVSFGVSNPSLNTTLSHASLLGRKGSNLASSPSSVLAKKASHPGGPKNKHSSGIEPTPPLESNGTVTSSPCGIALQSVNKITAGLDDFSLRVSEVLEIISTLSQFRRLQGDVRGLPRIAKLWDMDRMGDGSETDGGDELLSEGSSVQVESLGKKEKEEEVIGTRDTADGEQAVLQGRLSTLKEESLVMDSGDMVDGEGSTRDPVASSSSMGDGAPHSQHPPNHGHVHSAHPGDSVALMVKTSIGRIQGRMEIVCGRGVLDVFSTTGRHKATFTSAYEEYSLQIATLEENICAYLKAVFASVNTSERVLDIISRFAAVNSRVELRETLRRCMMVAFGKYSQELEEIQRIYEENKGSPPVSHNVPPMAGAVAWVRQLLRRVEGPMEVFRNDTAVMQSVESLHVCKLYNRLATALLKYEALWLGQWRSSIKHARAGLRATLLVQEEEGSGATQGSRIRVNTHDRLLELVAESKALVRLGIPIPDSAKTVLEQEDRLKHFKQQLEQVLESFYSVQEAIDPAIRPLLAPHVEAVVRSLLPGWTTLTWSTLNIDAFLHRVQASVSSLLSLAKRTGDILQGTIHRILGEIEKASLFDVELATGQVWYPQEFSAVMVASISERATKLLTDIATVQTAVMEIASLASSSSLVSHAHHELVPLRGTQISTTTDLRRTPTTKSSSRNTSQHGHQSVMLSGSVRGTSGGTTDLSHRIAVTFGETGERVLSHFCELVFEAVSKLVLRSHDQLCSSLWSSTRAEQHETRPGDDMGKGSCSPNESNRKGKEESVMVERKMVSFQDPILQETDAVKEPSHTKSKTSPHLRPTPTVSPPLQLVVHVHFSTPRIDLDPGLEEVHSYLAHISSTIVNVLHQITWWVGPNTGRSLFDVFEVNGAVESMQDNVLQAIRVQAPGIGECLSSLREFDLLWKQDLHATYQKFLEGQPSQRDCSTHVERFIETEEKIAAIPAVFHVGPLQLDTNPVKNSLRALAGAWKTEFVSFLHKQAKVSLSSLVASREGMRAQLTTPVETLAQLKTTLELLQHISDMQNTVDDLYLPVERLYALLRSYSPHLPRSEVQQVDTLREEWTTLTELADSVQHQLLTEQHLSYEREVDKQVKAFVVETIQFRNSFDTEGPLVPGLLPSEAITRLGTFLEHCEELKSECVLLGAVQCLLNIPPTPYPELDQTEQDLSFLRALYGNYQQFIGFDKKFRQELWAEVNLDSAIQEVEGFWHAYCSLPAEQQEWDASQKLRSEICQYRELLPLLKKLHSKEVRNRHWLQVMGVTNCTLQLEGSIFKMAHLLDAGLLLHVKAIEEIVRCGRLELELEEQFYSIEEEWSEQVLQFNTHKSRGPLLLAGDHTLCLLEELEHAQTQLATMLMSHHILPLREEASQWAVKLASIAEVLQQWLSVQELWHNLEAVFSDPSTATQFPVEAVRFTAIDTSWSKIMSRACETRNVMQCCLGGEVPKLEVLGRISCELEACKKSLSSYLLSKRQAFPRFYYVSDDSLLGILSSPGSTHSLQPHLQSLFAAIANIIVTSPQEGEPPAITAVKSPEGEVLQIETPVVLLSADVDVWISSLLSSLRSSLHQLLMAAITHEGSSFSLEECAHQSITQVAIMALYFHWARECEQALSQCRYDRRALPGARGKFNAWSVGKLSTLLTRHSWRSSGDPLTPLHRLRLEAMTTLSLWLRDILDDLCHRKLRDVGDFEWQRYLKPYLRPAEGGHAHQLVLRCLEQELVYGCEFLGCQPLPVFTSRTDNYIIALTQAMSTHLGSALVGPTGSGKVQLIKGVGQLCGRFVPIFHCSALTETAAIARTFEGLAQDGSWVCFSDVHNLPTSSLSVLSQMMHTVSAALQSRLPSCQLSCGREVPLCSELAVFLTHTTTPPPTHEWQMPSTLDPLFRSFSLALPDSGIVLRVFCTALGLRAPKALTNKLVTLQRMASDQLSPSSPQAFLSLSSLRHVLEVASGRLVGAKGVKQPLEHKLGGVSSSELQGPHHHTQGRSPSHDVKLRKPPSSFSLSPSTGQPLPPPALREHTLVAQLILSIIGPRFAKQELPVFVSMVRDVFAGSPEVASLQVQPLVRDVEGAVVGGMPATSSRAITLDYTSVVAHLKEQAARAGLTASEPWLSKVEQLLTMTQLKHAVLLAGQPATGKTAALQTVVSALNARGSSDKGTNTSVKMLRIFPGVCGDPSELYGHVNSSSGDWVDGIFTSIFRKAHKATQTVTWVCLDGPLHSSWVHPLSELLGRSKVMTLSNGEHLVMSERNLKLVLESGSLKEAAPPTLASCGIVYFDSNVLGWRPVVQSWLGSRKPHETQCLQKYFDRLMSPIVEFVLQKSGMGAVYSEVGLLGTCLAYLTTLLNTYVETAEVFSEVHVERLLLFALIWSFGGVLLTDQRRFSQLLKTLTNSLPDDDSEYSVFDYYVDESGEWDVWQSRVPEQPTPQVDLTGSVFVDTTDTIRTEVLLELALVAGRNVLLVGPHGSGKTMLCKHFLQARALSFGMTEVVRQVVFSGHTSSSSLHHLVQVNFHHRQGYTYGPKNGRRLQLFIDDLHLPLRHSSSAACTSHEYLRQLMDSKGLYSLQKCNDWCTIEDLLLFTSLTSDTGVALAPRLQRHFAMIQVPNLSDHTLKRITSEMLHSFLPRDIQPDTIQGILAASVEAYSAVKQTLKVSDMPGRQHYFFSLTKLESVFQGLSHCLDTPDGCGGGVAPGWCHEVRRAFMEGLCRVSDVEWMEGCINSLGRKYLSLSADGEKRPLALSAIPTEIQQGEEHPASIVSPLSTLPEVRLEPLEEWTDVGVAVGHYLMRYREECAPLQLDPSTNTLKTLVQLHRTLKFPRGNCILVGSLGQPLKSLARFALYIAGYSLQPLDTTKGTTAFSDGLRMLFRQAGLEGKPTAVVVNERDLSSVEILEALNALVACGELPSLFSNDEMDGLLQALSPCIKRDFPSEETDPMQYFTARIYRNLRIVVCLSPSSPLLTCQAHDFKGLLQGCHLIWMRDWTKKSLINTVEHFFTGSPLIAEVEDRIRNSLYMCLSAVHCCLMQETGQLLQAGLQPNHLQQQTPQSTPPHPHPPPATPSQEGVSQSLPPTSFECLMEKVLRMESEMEGRENGVKLPYIGPRTFLQFLECFCTIFKRKHLEATTEKLHLSKALETYHCIQCEVGTMKTTLSELKHKLQTASKLSSTLLSELTSKSCQLERLKALLGQGSSVLSAMQMVSEQERLLAENEDDDEELLAVFVDRQSSRLELLLHRAREQVLAAEEEEKEAKLAMDRAKEQAHFWHSKIDRNTIDQIKSLNSPPRLVGAIMELMLTLLQQYGTGTEQQTGIKSDGSSSSTPGHPPPVKKRPSGVAYTSGTSTDASRMEKDQWLAILLAIGDSQKFLDLLNSLKWEDGLSTDAVNLIESKLVTSHNSPTAAEPRDSDPNSTRPQCSSLITVTMAKHAAESAATMCGFAVAIVEYHHSFKPYRVAIEKLQRVRQELHDVESSVDSAGVLPRGTSEVPHKLEPPELEGVEEESEAGEEGLERLREEVVKTQGRMDKAIMEKHSLGRTCQQLAEKLKSASNLLESLKMRKESWESRLSSLPPLEVLVANCILAAAFTIYCGPLSTSARHKVFDSLVDLCQSCGLPSDNGHTLLSLSSYPSFMLGEPPLYHLVIEGLPQDPSSQQNACIITHPHARVWPLVVDPLGMVEQWLKGREAEAVIVEHKSPMLPSALQKCLQAGTPLVITAVDTVELAENRLLMDMLQCRSSLHTARGGQKITMGDKEVECNPGFRLYLVTSDPLQTLPPLVSSLVCVVVFRPERGGLGELLLDSFLLLQNPKTSHDRELLRNEIYSHAVQLQSVEEELLQLLASQKSPMEDPPTTRSILTLNNAHEETHESLVRLLGSYSVMNEVHLATLRLLASHAAVIVDVVCAMGSLLPTYRTSYCYAQTVFLSFVEQAGSYIQGEEALLKMMRAAYSHFTWGYFERDRLLFSLTLALEIEISRGRATREECHFLVSPSAGKQFAVKGLVADPSWDAGVATTVSFGKKPFDWMTDTQWQMLLMLSSHFGWFHEILERLGKDGKETVWRMVGEGAAPGTINVAEGIGYKLFPLQQLLILRAMRPERITQCIIFFITTVFQHKQRKLNYDAPIELRRVARACQGNQVPLILYRDDPTLPPAKVQLLATKAEVPLTILSLHGSGTEEEAAKRNMEAASSQGHWLLLHNIHTCPLLLSQLPTLLRELPSRQQEGWKLWLSACVREEENPHLLPVSLLQSACKVVLDPPKSIRASVLHSLSEMAGDIVTCSSRPEWLPLLHNIAMLHATVRPRKEAYPPAWAKEYTWKHTHLMDTLCYVAREFRSSEVVLSGVSGVKPISWSGIRHLISEVFYGSLVTDPTDAFVFAALTEHWVHPGGPKREVGRYHIPSQFFVPGTRLGTLVQAVEGVSPPLVFTAEICGLYYTPIIQLGSEDYLFPHLALLSSRLEQYSNAPTLSTPPRQDLLPPLTQRRPTATEISAPNMAMASTISRSTHPIPSVSVEKLPSFIQVSSQISEVVFTGVPRSLIRGLGGDMALLRELPLRSTAEKLAENVPSGWRKEILQERLKRHGLDTPFGLFLKNETARMAECLHKMHSSLQELQVVLSDDSKGDTLLGSPHLVDLSLSLLSLCPPRHWQQLVGPSSPPLSWPLREWVQDLVLRFTFLDRLLAGGIAKTPTYWLGAFFNPQAFLSVVQQQVTRSLCVKSGAVEQLSFSAELTNRDKDHIRDPPPEGELFIYGVHLWGCGYEKTANLELQDIPPKSQVPVSLPLLHLSVAPRAEQQSLSGPSGDSKGPYIFQCPCFVSSNTRGQSKELFTIAVTSTDVTPQKWAMRNLSCTLRPF